MSFSYHNCDGSQDQIDFPRLLVSDTTQFGPDGTTPIYIFRDSEITGVIRLQGLNFQSGMFYSATSPAGAVMGTNLPTSPVSYLRVAATLLDSLAANMARLANALKVLDVQVNTQFASQELRALAEHYRSVDDDAGAFMIIEQVNNSFSLKDRFWASVQRQSAL